MHRERWIILEGSDTCHFVSVACNASNLGVTSSAVAPLYFSKENKSITCNLNEIYYKFPPIITFIEKYDVEKETKKKMAGAAHSATFHRRIFRLSRIIDVPWKVNVQHCIDFWYISAKNYKIRKLCTPGDEARLSC